MGTSSGVLNNKKMNSRNAPLMRSILCVQLLLMVLMKDTESSLTSSTISKISPDRVLANTTFDLWLGGVDISMSSYIAIALPGECNHSRIVVMEFNSHDGDSGSVVVPLISGTGDFAICISNNAVLSTAIFFEQDIRIKLVSIFGLKSRVLYTNTSAQNIQLECAGECSGPSVQVGLSLNLSENCSQLLGNISIPYDAQHHNGSAPAFFPLVINNPGKYTLCWSADHGSHYSPIFLSIYVINQASHDSISSTVPAVIKKLQSTYVIFFSMAECSPFTFVAFVPSSQILCSNLSLIVPLSCHDICNEVQTCAEVTFPRNMEPGSYQICYSTSGRDGPYVLQTRMSSNLSVIEPDCTSCAPGEALKAESQCVTCNPGFFCPNGSLMIACPIGTYSSFAGSSTVEECVLCSPGTYSLPASVACELCDAGSFCLGGSMHVCSTGSFSLPGQSQCQECPTGYFCSSPELQPLPCPPGSFATSQNQSICNLCPSGSWSKQAASSCEFCLQGWYISNSTNISGCLPCPAGYFCESSHPIKCPKGTFSNGSSSICVACPTDTVSECGSSSCTPCPLGTRGDSVNGCSLCDSGYYSTNSSPCLPCPSGSMCPNGTTVVSCKSGYFSAMRSTTCTECSAGIACRSPSQPEDRITCALGTFAVQRQTFCFVCPAGYYCNDTKTDSRVLCPQGTYSSSGQSSCSLCEPGFFCADGETQACPPGTFSMAQSSSFSDCLSCPFGSFAPESASSGCFECPAGYTCVNSSKAYPCPAGTYSLSGSNLCYECPPWYHCSNASLAPVKCKDGYQSSRAATFCTPCPPGSFCTASGLFLPCPNGHYSLSGSSACSMCPSGYYLVPIGGNCSGQSIMFTNCSRCPAGHSCDEDQPPEPCSPGYFSAGGHKTCSKCELGFYSLGEAVFCHRCPAGSTCKSSDRLPQICPQGTYSFDGSTTCSICMIGSFSIQNSSYCPPCPPGMYCAPYQNPQVCPAGSYSLGNAGNCSSCSPGTFSYEGAAWCFLCRAGSICQSQCDAYTSPPQVCGAGHFSLQGASQCSQCGNGSYSASNSSSCDQCPRGYFCIGFKSPTPCSQGTYSQGSVSYCMACSPGTYSDTVAAFECHACPPGFFCPNNGTAFRISARRENLCRNSVVSSA
jgi:hypothetical protein